MPAAPPSRRQMVASGVAVVALAAGLRSLHLQTVPQVTDESAEVMFAWRIAFEGARPLTHTDSYNGPLWPYLMAVALRTAGPSPEVPRRVALALSLAAVAATFGLGSILARPRQRLLTATVAGLVMATNFTQILVGGRVAWSNSSTPLWTTLTALALLKATAGDRRRWWVVAGAAGGLALQSHPSVIAFLVGLAVWFLLDEERRGKVKGPGPALAVAAAVAAYAPVILYNARTGFDTIDQARASRNLVADPGVGAWATGVGAAMLQLGRSLVGGFDVTGAPAGPAAVPAVAVAIAVAILVAAARVGAAMAPGLSPVWRPGPRLRRGHEAPTPGDGRRPLGRRLPLVVTGVTVAILPLVNSSWDGFLEARYLGMLVPLLGAATGVVVTAALAAVPRRRTAVALAVGMILALPGTRAALWVVDAEAAGRHNQVLLDMTAMAADRSRRGRAVVVDAGLKSLSWPGRGNPRRAITYYLTLAQVPFDVAPVAEIRHHVALGDATVAFTSAAAAEELRSTGPVNAMAISAPGGYPAWGVFSTAP